MARKKVLKKPIGRKSSTKGTAKAAKSKALVAVGKPSGETPKRGKARRSSAAALPMPSLEARLAFSRIALEDWQGIPAHVLIELVEWGYLVRDVQYQITGDRPFIASKGYTGSGADVLRRLVSEGVLKPRTAFRVNIAAHAAWAQFAEENGDAVSPV